MLDPKVLVYIFRRDLRVADNPILHHLSTTKNHGFTHLLPIFVFPAQQIEVSGFINQSGYKSPYPEARSQVGHFWRCGPHRAKFIANSVWELKSSLENLSSGLIMRVGMLEDVARTLIESEELSVGAIWMTDEEGVEEKRDEKALTKACLKAGIEFKLWRDEKYYVDDLDVPLSNPKELPDVFTTYRKMVEPLRSKPRKVLPISKKGSLPQLPEASTIPAQHSPFDIPTDLAGIEKALLEPLEKSQIANPPTFPRGTDSAHPFEGGESHGHSRLDDLIKTGAMTSYKSTRNGLLGTDFSTKLSGWLSQGCITARQIHAALVDFEDGNARDSSWEEAAGYGQGENEGTMAVRYELLWRDYMRLCTRKFGPKLFHVGGFLNDPKADTKWHTPTKAGADSDLTVPQINDMIQRLLNGTSGMGLIDASQRELYLTGYTSNRARQNVASFLAKHLYIDWRIGAEWYESMLVDYDVSSNWGNWQYVAGVGNDPRGEARVFNPVKQAYDYDPRGEYVMAWVDELSDVMATGPTGSGGKSGASTPSVGEVFQACTMKWEKVKDLGLVGNRMVEAPLKKIDFLEHGHQRQAERHKGYVQRGRGRGRGGRGRGDQSGGGGRGGQSSGPASGPRGGRGSYGGQHRGGRGDSRGAPGNAERGTHSQNQTGQQTQQQQQQQRRGSGSGTFGGSSPHPGAGTSSF